MNNPVDFAPNLSAFKKEWLPLERAIQRVAKFEHDFGKAHLSLACHAALASILTPELVNLIRINFLEQSVEWIAESDLLLSSLCFPIHQSIYEIEPQIRQVLLVALQKDPAYGTERLEEIASLLYFHNESSLANKLPMYIKRTYQWISSAYLDPDLAVQNMVNFLENTHLENSASRTVNYQMIGKTLAMLANPLEMSNLQVELDDLVDSTYLVLQGYAGKSSFSSLLQRNSYTLDETIQPLTSSVVDWLIKLSPATSDYTAAMPTQSITPSTSHIPYLSAPLLQEALEAALALTDEENRVRTLVELTPYLPASQLHKALEVARSISNVERRAGALIGLVPHLSESARGSVLQEALETTLALADERSRAEALTGLAPYLSAPLLQEALEAARALTDEENRAGILTELAPYVKQLPVVDTKPVTVFCSYSHNDEYLLRELEKYLMPLQKDGLITYWHDRMVSAGVDPEQEINKYLNISQIILLLISADFLASDYCFGTELKRALERHQNSEAHVIPIILRPADWQQAPFAHLQALPTDARPITTWSNRDAAFADVAAGIRKIIEDQKNLRTLPQTPNPQRHPVNIHPIEVFCCYAPEDEAWLRKLEMQLSLIKRQGLISLWHDRPISPGNDRVKTIDTRLETASIIILLVSADFLASDYCYGIEMQRAMQRHEEGSAYVIPIILRPADWQRAPFAHLQALPTDAKPLTTWHNSDDGLVDIAAGIRRAIEELSPQRSILPKLWNIPFVRNPFFSGREDILSRLHEQLNAGQATALSQVQALSGLGGIGKTQIAIEYAYRYRQEYQAVFWARAESQEALISSYTNIANLLNLPEQNEQNPNILIETVKHWLQMNQGWLLIFDNADELDILEAFLPPMANGHMLLTTRSHAFKGLAQGISLDMLPAEQGALLLLRRAGLLPLTASFEQATANDQSLALQISQELGGLPLALDQAGAYIEETACSLFQYLQVYQQHRARLMKRRGIATNYPESVATTWSLTFARVEQSNPASADLLRLCAFLAPDNIPEEIIIKGASYLGPLLAPIAMNMLMLDQTISILLSYSLLSRNTDRDSDTATLSMHRLLQAILRDSVSRKVVEEWSERAVRAVNKTFPEVEFTQWVECERYLPHALVCASWIEQEGMIFLEAAQLLLKTGTYLSERALYAQAEPLFRQALAIQERALGSEHPDVALSLSNIALLYEYQSKYEEAEPLFQQALAIQERILGTDHPNTATSLNNLAHLYRNQGKYAQAEPLFRQALVIQEKVLGSEHPNTALSLSNIALLYEYQGKYEEAEPLFQQALAIQERILGSNHPDTATSLNNLAYLYRNQGKYEEAELLFQQALAIRERILGTDHPNTALSLSNIALLYKNQGKYAQAEPLFQQALAIRERMLGPNHRSTASSLNNLADLYQNQGKYEEAEPLFQRALAIQERILGSEHPDTASSLNNLAYLYREQRKYEQAQVLFQRALTIREQILGPEHPDTATSLNNLALLYEDQGRYAQAEPLFQRALAICEQQLGPEHPDTVIISENYASILKKAKETKSQKNRVDDINTIEPGSNNQEETEENSIEYYTCFISYSSKDYSFAERLYTDLTSQGVRCWFAPVNMKPGDKVQPRIDEALRMYDKLLLILSENSIASHWTEREVENALTKEARRKSSVIFPIRLDNIIMESEVSWASHIRRTRQIGDFMYWKEHDAYLKSLNRLLHDLRIEPPQNSIGHDTCFIGYSAHDQIFVEQLCANLETEGIACWLASEDLRIGDNFRRRIDEAIRSCSKFLLVISEHSITSSWIEFEVEAVLEKERAGRSGKFFPICIDDSYKQSNIDWIKHIGRTRHIGNFQNWKEFDSYQKALSRLIYDLKK